MSKIQKVIVLDDEVQARLIDSILNDREIPHVMRSYHDSAYDGLYQLSKGWGHVEASEEHAEEIKLIFQELKDQTC